MSEGNAATTGAANKNSGVIIAAYVCGAIGLMVLLGVAFCILRRIRGHRARKYIKQQRNRSTGIGPVFTSESPKNPTFQTVKAAVKARQVESNKIITEAKVLDKEEAEIRNGSTVSMNGNEGSTSSRQPISTISLGPASKKMHGQNYERVMKVRHARTIKHERMRVRLDHKRNKRENKTRQKEIKHLLTEMLGDTLDGTFVPSSTNGRSFSGDNRSGIAVSPPETTHVGILRRESLAELPDIPYLIEKSPRDVKGVSTSLRRTQGAGSLSVPQSLNTWDEEALTSGSLRIPRSPRHSRSSSAEVVDVTVHKMTDTQTHAYHNEALQDVEDTTEV